MNQNFNAIELMQVRQKAESIFSSLSNNISKTRNACYDITNIIRSEDSDLGSRWQNLGASMTSTGLSFSAFFNEVLADMNQYIERTVENETKASKELNKTDSEISELNQMAGSIVGGLSNLGLSTIGGIGAPAGVVNNITGTNLPHA